MQDPWHNLNSKRQPPHLEEVLYQGWVLILVFTYDKNTNKMGGLKPS
jgi:hypothetical protein